MMIMKTSMIFSKTTIPMILGLTLLWKRTTPFSVMPPSSTPVEEMGS